MSAPSPQLADHGRNDIPSFGECQSATSTGPRWSAWMRCPEAGRPPLSVVANDDALASIALAGSTHAESPFSDLELRVIAIGERDPLRLVRPESRLGKLQKTLFGIEAPLPFADRRLEALRRLVVAGRRGARRFAFEAAFALEAGVTPQQIQHLRMRAFNSGSF